jgi:catechol 2,3-dioxygenase
MKPSLRFESIQLRVRDLARSVDFYTRGVGFVARSRTAECAELATERATPPSLVLVADPAAARAPDDTAGLFHAALLLPTRAALGRWLRHAANEGVSFDGFSDHGVSEAIYLTDPDGNGLEFYADRPREAWPFVEGELAMGTLPLAVPDLLAAATPADEPLLAGAHWGHLHLRVSDLDRSEAFYSAALGLKRTQRFGNQARFLAADDYHHHIGLNTWGGIRRPQPPGALGFSEATFARVGSAESRTVRDPDGLTLQIHDAR